MNMNRRENPGNLDGAMGDGKGGLKARRIRRKRGASVKQVPNKKQSKKLDIRRRAKPDPKGSSEKAFRMPGSLNPEKQA